MAETHDETAPRTARRARNRRPQPTASPTASITPAAAADEVSPTAEAGPATAPAPTAAVRREVISLYAALESASAEAQSAGHPLTLRRSGEGKYVATCSRCGLDLPLLDTARGWTYPSLGACSNPVRAES